jgi:hypothetical protein
MWVLFVEHDAERSVKRPEAGGCKVVAQLLDARLMTDRGVWIWAARGTIGGVLAALTVHMIVLLGQRVIRFQVVVRKGPRRGNSARMLHRAEVLAPEPEQRGALELGVAADAVVGVGVQLLAIAVVPDFFGLVLALDIYGPRAPVVLFARHVISALQQQNASAGRRELAGECPAAGAGPDDHHVIMPFIAHG